MKLNLEAAGVELTERGFIKVNEFQKQQLRGVRTWRRFWGKN